MLMATHLQFLLNFLKELQFVKIVAFDYCAVATPFSENEISMFFNNQLKCHDLTFQMESVIGVAKENRRIIW